MQLLRENQLPGCTGSGLKVCGVVWVWVTRPNILSGFGLSWSLTIINFRQLKIKGMRFNSDAQIVFGRNVT